MPKSDNRVAVVGGGITGLTTAILLQVNGYRTFLYAKDQPSREPDVDRPPEFASLHAAASVLPHSVESPKVERWTSISQAFFRALTFRATCGVRTQVHYEVSEEEPERLPEYASAVTNFELLSDPELQSNWVPRRKEAQTIYGWKFDAFFCEAPEYVRYLYELYRGIGGRVLPPSEVPGDGELVSYLELDYRYYVNCTGIAAVELLREATRNRRLTDMSDGVQFEALVDPSTPSLIRGHYLKVDIKQILTGYGDRFFSYNYKPIPAIYQTPKHTSADVYCYPRSDAWILGGSRQEGTVEDGVWIGEETVGDEVMFERSDGTRVSVPAPIYTLNSHLLKNMTGLDLDGLVAKDPTIVSPAIGYRFVRDAPGGVRVSCSHVRVNNEKFVFHNYGHGGSGFTLSWGCAYDLLRTLDGLTGRDPDSAETRSRRSKFLVQHSATRLILSDLTAQLIESGY